MDRRRLALEYARAYIGTFYSWGGDDPSGFDCSGFVLEVLQAVGIVPRAVDMTADALRRHFAAHQSVPRPGALLFRGDPAVHVEMVFAVIGEDVITIGASGGTSKTKTKDDAVRDNAFIKLRPWAGTYSSCVDPFKER
jgi:hypothetical protein